MEQNKPLPSESIWCAVPVFNNKDTVRQVAAECRAILPNVVVVDDGSTDCDITTLLAGLDVVVLRHGANLGKGRAILTASRYIEDQGGLYMLTIDGDGQHLPRDIERFLPLLRADEPCLVIGCRNFDTANVPSSSRFGRSFANFWLLVETGKVVADCQSGFRAYPVRQLNELRFKGAHYDFEAEVLARAAWGGLELKTVDIDVIYPKPEERVSSFKPFLDNLRLTRIHSMLVGRRMVPIRHQQLVAPRKTFDLSLLRHPGKVLRMLLQESATPEGLALSAAVGLFIAVLPLLFMHSIVLLYVAVRFNLNKLVTLNIQHLAMPPFMPALCIEVGYYLRHGRWLTDLSFTTVFQQFSSRLFEWFLGSLIIAPLAALLAWVVIFRTAVTIRKARCAHASKKGVERKRGNRLGFWFFHAAARIFGLGGAYGLLYFVGLYYLLVDRPVVVASLAYVRRRFPEHGSLRQLFDVYRLFVSQGKCLVDRFAVAAGYGDISIEIKGYEKLLELTAGQEKGFILLTAHVGNWQVAMTALEKFGRPVCLMMRPEDNLAVKKALNIYNEEERIRIIFTDDSLGGVIEALNAIKQGSVVSIMGDRAYDYSATEASFLGDDVRFPYGAFSIAAAAQCPVVVFLSAKVGRKQYLVDVSHVIPAPGGVRGKRDAGLKLATQEYATILEEYVQAYPYQWFVFRDIWKSNS